MADAPAREHVLSDELIRYFEGELDERRDIVILSYVLPAEINIGYTGLGQRVVSKFNGMKIRSMADVVKAQKLNPESKCDIIEFEMDSPTIVISREQLAAANTFVSRNYGIEKLSNVGP